MQKILSNANKSGPLQKNPGLDLSRLLNYYCVLYIYIYVLRFVNIFDFLRASRTPETKLNLLTNLHEHNLSLHVAIFGYLFSNVFCSAQTNNKKRPCEA